MAARMKCGHFEPDGGLIYLPIGFVPDLFLMAEIGATNPIFYIWWERQQDDQATGSQEGTKIAGAAGTFDKLADAGGIVAYDSGSQLPVIGRWRAAQTTLLDKAGTAIPAFAAKSATAHGTYCIGTTSGTDVDGADVDRDAIFECVAGTAGTTGATEPAWPVEIGQNSALDGSTIIWQKVNAPLIRGGYQGVRIAAAITTNGQEMYFAAFQEDGASEDYGDVDGWTGGIRGT